FSASQQSITSSQWLNNVSSPVIARVMDCIYLGNLNAAYSGRALCKNNIDSIIDMSNLPSDRSLSIIPCTCNRGGLRHSWSRLKVDIQGLLDGKYPVLTESCFQDINECIDASLEKRKRVLIHCTDGYSLAPTCVIQYLMVKHKMRLMAAYEFVRARYPLNIRECHQNLLVDLFNDHTVYSSGNPGSCRGHHPRSQSKASQQD
uniref:protein-tyrosine-phosphatase n=1 Tax=Crocodylus porosus TaxID=8502 RepID=A0A7M4FIG9_CROPO